MHTYTIARRDDRKYARTSFSSFRLQPLEYQAAYGGFYQINSLTFIDKDNNILPITKVKEESENKATFILNGNITGTVTYDNIVWNNSYGVGKLLKDSGWFCPYNLDTLPDKPFIEFTFSNIIPRLSKITWNPYSAGYGILKINFLSDIEFLDIDTTKENEIKFSRPSILEMYKNRPTH